MKALAPRCRLIETNFRNTIFGGSAHPVEIALNGAAAHKGKPGDLLVIITFIQLDPEEASAWEPRLVIIEDKNTKFKNISSQIED